MGQKIVSVLVIALAFFVALEPALASSHHKKLHGHLRNHATYAGIHTLRKLLPLSSLSNASTPSAQHELAELHARDHNMQQWRPDAANQSQGVTSWDIHGDLSTASRQSTSSINGDLGKSAADVALTKTRRAANIQGDLGKSAADVASTKIRRAANINGDHGRNVDTASRKVRRSASVNGDVPHMLGTSMFNESHRNVDVDAASPRSKRNVIVHDQRNTMEAAQRSVPITNIKDETALYLKKNQEKNILKSFNNSHAK